MTTRLELRTAVRRRLEDTGATPLWDDAALNDFLADATRRYGVRVPAERSASVVVPAGATSVPVAPVIAADRVVRVLDEDGEAVPRQSGQSGQGGQGGQAWRWWNGALTLAHPLGDGATWQVEYLAGRSLPADDATAVDVVAGDEEIVVLLAAATALRRRAVEDLKRGGGREAGPVARLADGWVAEAERLLGARRRRVRGGWVGV